MMENLSELLNGNIDIEEYQYINGDGSYEARFVGRRMGENGTLMCYFDLADGRKIKAMTWKNRKYKGLDRMPLGSLLMLHFYYAAKSGRNYLDNATILEGPDGEMEDDDEDIW